MADIVLMPLCHLSRHIVIGFQDLEQGEHKEHSITLSEFPQGMHVCSSICFPVSRHASEDQTECYATSVSGAELLIHI